MHKSGLAASLLALSLVFQPLAATTVKSDTLPEESMRMMQDYLTRTGSKIEFLAFLNFRIEKKSADDFEKRLRELSAKSPTEPITIWYDSVGGSVEEGWRISKLLRIIPNPVNLVCLGNAASMAAIIYISHPRDKGRRYAYPTCKFMTHAAYNQYADGKREGYKKDPALVVDRKIFASIIAGVANISFPEALKFVREEDKILTLPHARRVRFFDELLPTPPQPAIRPKRN